MIDIRGYRNRWINVNSLSVCAFDKTKMKGDIHEASYPVNPIVTTGRYFDALLIFFSQRG